MLVFPACIVIALFSGRLSNKYDKEPVQPVALIRPARDDEWRVSRLRVPARNDSHDSAATATYHPAQRNQTNSIQHAPDFFTHKVPLETLLSRNNLLTVYTGCSIAAWTYGWHVNWPRARPFYDDCGLYSAEKQWTGRDVTIETVSEIQPGDSIYVELKKLGHFVKHLLPLIKVEFVLLSGQNHIAPMKPPLRPPYSRKEFTQVVDNPNVKHWFMMNLDKYSYNPFHPKVRLRL